MESVHPASEEASQPLEVTEAAGVNKYGADDVERLRAARDRWDQSAISLRDQRTRRAIWSACLSPVAVALLAVQILFAVGGGYVAIGLIALEFSVLSGGLASSVMRLNASHHDWIRARLRTELLRREEFLYRSHVGPYLHGGDLSGTVDDRLQLLENEAAATRDLVRLVALEDGNDTTWHHALEDTAQKPIPASATLLDEYRTERIDDQIKFFTDKALRHLRLDAAYDNLAKGSLIAALVVAAFHLGLLAQRHTTDFGNRDLLHTTVELLALILPPLAGTFLALRSSSESHRLNRAYRDQANQLLRIRQAFGDLERKGEQEPPETFLRTLKRLILRSEEVLAKDLHQWYLIVDPEPPQGTA